MFNNEWHERFMSMAALVSTWSKDPSTKAGGVIVRPDKSICSVGYNGFPRGIADTEELLNNREEKYKRVVHSEINAILNAREPLHGYVLYNWPGQSCVRCAVHVIQAGIKHVVAPTPDRDSPFFARWWEQMIEAEALFDEAGVQRYYVDLSYAPLA